MKDSYETVVSILQSNEEQTEMTYDGSYIKYCKNVLAK